MNAELFQYFVKLRLKQKKTSVNLIVGYKMGIKREEMQTKNYFSITRERLS